MIPKPETINKINASVFATKTFGSYKTFPLNKTTAQNNDKTTAQRIMKYLIETFGNSICILKHFFNNSNKNLLKKVVSI